MYGTYYVTNSQFMPDGAGGLSKSRKFLVTQIKKTISAISFYDWKYLH